MYAVVWRQVVLDALADLYITLSLDDQDRMADGVKTFNARLASNPFDVGEGAGRRPRPNRLPAPVDRRVPD